MMPLCRELSLIHIFTQAERELVPVIRDEAGPIAVCGFGAAERVRPEEGHTALRIDVIKK